MPMKGKLLTHAQIMAEYGVSKNAAEKWMQQLPKVRQPGGVKRVYVWRADLERMLEEATIAA